jgi:hypothetical protein
LAATMTGTMTSATYPEFRKSQKLNHSYLRTRKTTYTTLTIGLGS